MPWLADIILVVHACIVLFVLGGAAYIWLGAWRNWPGIRSPLFRRVHLAVMLFVAAEAILGIACPLTRWENILRGDTTHAGFIENWVGRLIYYNLPPWVFTLAYLAFAAALVVTFIKIPPRCTGGTAPGSHDRFAG